MTISDQRSRRIRCGLSNPPVLAAALLVAAGTAGAAGFPSGGPSPGAASVVAHPAVEDLSRAVPLTFVENRGQFDERVDFAVYGHRTSVFFTRQGPTISLNGASSGAPGRWTLKLDFVEAEPVEPQGRNPARATLGYFTGPRTQWKTGVKTYESVVYRDLWPGIDLSYSGRVDELKHNFLVEPGVDPSRIRFRIRGASGVTIADDGSLLVETPYGDIVDAPPLVYQVIDGVRVEVPSRYDLQSDRDGDASVVGFVVGEYDPSLPLVVDPATLVYCGYIGGSSADRGHAIAVDGSGFAYVAGSTSSDQTTFPEAVGPDLTHNGMADAFVAKVAVDGSGLVWAGFIGGAAYETTYGIAVDPTGSAYVTGYTESDEATFPITVGPAFGGDDDAFVAKVAADGSSLDWCRYIGGTNGDQGYAIDVDDSGHAFVTGWTDSLHTSFPVTAGSYRTTLVGMRDAFVAKLDTDGAALVFCTYLGSDASDSAWGIKVDASGASYIAGYTQSSEYLTEQFPVTSGSFGETHCGGHEAFVTKLSADGSSLVYSGLLCGSEADHAYAIAIDDEGAAYVTGETDSTEFSTVPFPLVVGPDLTHGGLAGKADAFVTKVAPDGGSLVYSGFIGGANYWFEIGAGIDVDHDGNAYVAGYTWASESTFPVLEGPDLTYNLNQDAFVARVRADGAAFDYSGYIGGSTEDSCRGLAVDADGDAYVAGWTGSTAQMGFPVLVGPSLVQQGGDEAFVAKVTFCGHSMTLAEDTWTLISLPCDPGTIGNTVGDIFGDDGLGVYGTDWAVLERDETADAYVLLDETDSLAQGVGYWIKVLVGDHTLDDAGDRTDTTADFDIGLVDAPSPGRWNMVGHPHAFSVSWGDVMVRDGDPPNAVYSLSEAASGAFIEGRWMYKYNGSAYQTYHPGVGSPTLDIFDGFWVRVLDNATLVIPPTAADVGASSAGSAGQWWVRLTVSGDNLEDPENYLGRSTAALDGQDDLDLPELEPFAAPYLTVVFPHPGWTGDRWAYTADFKELRAGAGGSWDFEVRSDAAREVTLGWTVGGGGSEILERSILVDEESGEIIVPFVGGSYATPSAGPVHRFTWRVNSLPQVEAGPDRIAGTGLPLEITAAFSDEDPDDSHTATVDWGDGLVTPGEISAGTVSASHVFNEVGLFGVIVCVEDDLGGRGCDDLLVDVHFVLFADDFESGSTAEWSNG